MTYLLNIQLVGVDSPKVWRQIRISSEMSLYQLHIAVQTAMGWTDSHPHCFSALNSEGDTEIIPTCDETGKSLEVRIKKHLSPERPVMHYIYDFGDYWDHEIRLDGVMREVTAFPECTGGGGACPPENSGGPAGYRELLARGEISRERAAIFSADQADAALTDVFLKSVLDK